MLDTIRRHQQSWLTYLIFVALIVVFAVNFGPGSSSCRSVSGSNYAAIVDGDYIRQQEFGILYGRQLEMLRQRAQGSGMDFGDIAEKIGLKQQVIDQLVSNKILAHEAARRGLVVSDAELLKELETRYSVTNVTRQQYERFVENTFQTNIPTFENDVRNEILGKKLSAVVTDNVSVSDDELKRDFMRERDRAMIDYVRFDMTGVKLAEPDAAAIDKLLTDDAKAVNDRYNADALKYRTPEERQARQIVVKLAKDASDAEVEKARAQLRTLKDQIDAGADFAAVAKASSQDDATRAQGGDLGWHKRGELPPAIEDAIFKLKANELSAEPVRTSDGLHLVQLAAIRPPAPKPFDEVKREVAASILRERSADAQLATAADALLTQLRAGKALTELTVSEDEARAQKTAAAVPAKGKPAAKGKAAAKPAADKPVRYESAWITKSEEAIPRIGVSPELHGVIFALTTDKPLADKVFKVGHAYYVVVLKNREIPDLAKFEAEKQSLRQQALSGKRYRVFQDWLKHLREQATVELNSAIFGPGRKTDAG